MNNVYVKYLNASTNVIDTIIISRTWDNREPHRIAREYCERHNLILLDYAV